MEGIPRTLAAHSAAYTSRLGSCYHGDAVDVLRSVADESIDLVCTSPPYALRREKAYGNVAPESYIDWFMPIAEEVHRVLHPEGSFVVELGGTWNAGIPTQSTMPECLLLRLCELFHLAQRYYWHNTRALPSPTQWVCKARVRCKESVTPIWWLGRGPQPHADNRAVLTPYARPGRRPLAGTHPSGHKIVPATWAADNGGAIPPNCFVLPGVAKDDYMRRCQAAGQVVHPARQPPELPDFFIRFLTQPGQLVLDPFAGSNTTGRVAEDLGRRWVAIEIQREYVDASRLRFEWDAEEVKR